MTQIQSNILHREQIFIYQIKTITQGGLQTASLFLNFKQK